MIPGREVPEPDTGGAATLPADPAPRASSASTRGSRWSRRLGRALIAAGLLTLAWVVVVWQWQDPFTALYTLYEQHELARSYDRKAAAFLREPPPAVASIAHTGVPPAGTHRPTEAERRRAIVAQEKREIGLYAARYRHETHEGDPLGRIVVHRLGLNMVFLDGTSESSLEKGPGRDLQTYMPGQNRLIYIAGHRTTFLAPFSQINTLRPGDRIELEVPYGTFVYIVTHHVIVPATDLAVLRTGSKEVVALQACHPRFFATNRYIVYARLSEVIPNVKPRLAYKV
jgi:sortase A